MSEVLEMGPATADEERLVERRSLETLIGFMALRWRKGWAAERSHCFVARLDDEVVSSIMALELPLHWPTQNGGTERRIVAGLDALVTPVRHRRRGFAGRLLEWVNEWAEERGFAGTALFSEIGPGYYQARGYRVVPMRFSRGQLPLSGVEGPLGSPPPGRVVGRPFNSVDRERVAAAYSAVAPRYPLSVARDPEYWDYHLDHSRFVEDLHSDIPDVHDFVVADEGACAYVRSRSDGDIFTVLEAAGEPGAEETVRGLLVSELARAAGQGCLRVALHLAPGAWAPDLPGLRDSWYETFLVRPTPGHAEALDMLLEDSFRAGGESLPRGAPPYIFRPDYF